MLVKRSQRSNQPELMDDFKEGLSSLQKVFDDINRANALLGGNSITINAVRRLFKEHPQEHYTLVDMGCGDGAMLRELVRYCRKNKINVKCIGVDLNASALQLAKKASVNYREIEYHQRDILLLQAADFNCDIVISTLCMHHIADENIGVFVRKFNELAAIGVVINDLQRSKWAYYLYKFFSAIFIQTKTAKIDGLISISRGFLKSELLAFAKHVPGAAHSIKWKWAFRYVWVMKPKRLK